MKAQCKETSMLLLFDGGSRSNRQLIEQTFGDKVPGGGGLFDWIVLYRSTKSAKGKRNRKVFAGSVRCETAFLRLSVPRVRLAVKAREDDFTSNEECNTNDLHMVNVPPPGKLPRILRSDKTRIFPDATVPNTVKSSSLLLVKISSRDLFDDGLGIESW
jgi:hypothetical protein